MRRPYRSHPPPSHGGAVSTESKATVTHHVLKHPLLSRPINPAETYRQLKLRLTQLAEGNLVLGVKGEANTHHRLHCALVALLLLILAGVLSTLPLDVLWLV